LISGELDFFLHARTISAVGGIPPPPSVIGGIRRSPSAESAAAVGGIVRAVNVFRRRPCDQTKKL